MGLFSRKKYIEKADFPSVIESLARSFEALREDYIYGSLTQLKREGVDISGTSRDIPPGSELEDALKGFQLTSCVFTIRNRTKSRNRGNTFLSGINV